MLPDEEGFLQPVIDAAKCVGCGKCEKTCPISVRRKKGVPLAVYAANAKDEELRRGSSSGGAFSVLARDVLSRGGVVYGAGFDPQTWRVVHIEAEDVETLDLVRGSKYVQSDVGLTFRQVRQRLEEGREVLYSGCPCQIAALKQFLGKSYPNLLTVDLICHGVPSPKVWDEYLKKRKAAAGSDILRIYSRRFCSWRAFSIAIDFEEAVNSSYCQDRWNDPYMISFVSFWSLRTACHHCGFRGFRSGADITLGDYNNAAELNEALDDDLGTSAVILLTQHGVKCWKRVCDRFETQESSIGHLMKANPAIYRNHAVSRLRRPFYGNLGNRDFDELVRWLQGRRQGSLTMHLLWWLKRRIVNRERNRIHWW